MSRVHPETSQRQIRQFLRTISGHRRWVLATAGISAAAASSGIGLIAFASVLISRSALLTSTVSLALVIVAVRFFATTRVVLRYAERMVGHLGTFRLLTRIRTWFFDAVTPLAPRGLTDRRTGELLSSILTDVDTMQDLYLRVLVPPAVAAITMLITAAVIAASDLSAAAALVAVFAISIALLVTIRRGSERATIEIAEARSHSAAIIIESLDAARELVMFDAQEGVHAESRRLDREADRAGLRLAAARGRSDAVVALASATGAMVVLTIVISGVRAGSIPGDLLAMFPLVALVGAEALQSITPTLDALDRSRSAARRLLLLADRAESVRRTGTIDDADDADTSQPPSTPWTDPFRTNPLTTLAVEIRDLTMITDSGRRILDGVSVRVARGDVLVITGESGSGKSTLIDLILGFDTYEGHVAIDGIDPRSLPDAAVMGSLCAVRQHDHVFDTTIRDNLALADPDADDEQFLGALGIAGLSDAVTALPEGLDTRTGPDGAWLSGGERQRLLIARALLAERPILLLDEAFEHLDAHTRQQVLRSVLDHREGRTTVLVSHDPTTIARSTAVLELRDGHVVIDAPGAPIGDDC